jgi:hypothetical protein
MLLSRDIVSQITKKNQSDRGKTPRRTKQKRRIRKFAACFAGEDQGKPGILEGIGNRNGFS